MSKNRKYKSLDNIEITRAVRDLPDWTLQNGRLHAVFDFKSFRPAFGFMTQVALKAESIDHHPEWSNVYKQVTIDLITHITNSITSYDLELAQAISEIYRRYK